ncbi:beta-ketoacyl synthase N-terminal-like domain-containing protein [Streptomyces flaveolus]|uniref:beta-ketoacyl synthase N-terminal-like domain-containing protein n=1 Tax=Streptomyces flaveolus TaxID=67297 RepID=UPI0038243E04
MDKREILTRFKDGTLERRHTLALLSGTPAPVRAPASLPTAQKDAAPPSPAQAAPPGPKPPEPGHTTAPCAVIGVQARLPHAGDLAALWRTELTGDPALPAADADGPDVFDAAALGLTDRQAPLIGPGERLLLDTARRVLQSSGYAGVRLDGLSGPDGQRRCVAVFTALTGTGRPQDAGHHLGGAAGRLSHLFDLRGPSRHVDTGPSSFLTALHLGLAALRAGECAAALVAAAGPGPGGTGAAAVLLKPLADARRCADVVHAVVLADAAAHPGRGPQSALGERLRRRAVEAAGIPQTAVGLQETGKTGEGEGTVGGATAFLRALLQLKHATLLPSPGRPGPGPWPPAHADGAAPPRTALAGVYEPGAEHAVVVLQEPPPAPSVTVDAAEPELVLLSAPTPGHLVVAAAQLADLLTAAGPAGGARPPGPAAVARELRLGRAAQACRLALVADRTDRLADALSAFAAGTAPHGVRTADLRAASGGPLLLAGLTETSAYLGALWQGRHFEQLTRLWLAGADVLTVIPGDDAAPVLELPAGTPPPHRPGNSDADADTADDAGPAHAPGERRGGQP